MNDLSPKDRNKRRVRNIALFSALLAFVVLIYGITIVKIKAGYGP